MAATLRVLSACYYPDSKPAHMLVSTCKRFGIPVTLYGVGSTYCGYADAKIHGLAQAIKSVVEPYTLYADCLDSLVIAGSRAIVKAYESAANSRALLFSPDMKCFPLYDLKPHFQNLARKYGKGSPYQYLCAGVFMAPTRMLRSALKILLERQEELADGRNMTRKQRDDDQGWWSLAAAQGMLPVQIDYQGNVCVSFKHTRLNEYEIKPGEVTIKATGGKPKVLHFNGPRGKRIQMPQVAKAVL